MKNYVTNEIVVAFALKEEGGEKLEKLGANVIYTGLGKVNATYQITKAIHEFKPKLVLNFGTAGSTIFSRGAFVQAKAFLQRDMDVSPLGCEQFKTPFETVPKVLNAVTLFNLPEAIVGSGDSFEVNLTPEKGEVVDMEAYAMAKVCFFEKVAFASVKFISDGANADASSEWHNSLKSMPNTFEELFLQLTSIEKTL